MTSSEPESSESVWVYSLLDPRTGKARYVGLSVDPVQRVKQHLRRDDTENEKKPNAKRKWLNDLKRRHLEPELALLEQVRKPRIGTRQHHPEAIEAEQRWLVRLARDGHDLTNGRLPEELRDTDEDEFQRALERGRDLFGGPTEEPEMP